MLPAAAETRRLSLHGSSQWFLDPGMVGREHVMGMCALHCGYHAEFAGVGAFAEVCGDGSGRGGDGPHEGIEEGSSGADDECDIGSNGPALCRGVHEAIGASEGVFGVAGGMCEEGGSKGPSRGRVDECGGVAFRGFGAKIEKKENLVYIGYT